MGGRGQLLNDEVKHFKGLLLSIRCRSSVIGRQSPAVAVGRRLWVSCRWSIGWPASSVIDRWSSRVRVVGRLSSSTVGCRSSVVCRSSVIGRWSSVLLRRLSVAGVVSSIVGRLSSAIRRVVVGRGRRSSSIIVVSGTLSCGVVVIRRPVAPLKSRIVASPVAKLAGSLGCDVVDPSKRHARIHDVIDSVQATAAQLCWKFL